MAALWIHHPRWCGGDEKARTGPGRPTRERRSKLEKLARMGREACEATGPVWTTKDSRPMRKLAKQRSPGHGADIESISMALDQRMA